MTLRHDAMTCQSDVIFLKEMEISIHTFTRRELWKHKWNMTCITWTTKYYDDMTWFMTICHHVTYVTYVTWRQGMTSWATSFISDFFYKSLWVNWSDDFTIVSHGIYVMKFNTAIAVCVTSTRDLETEVTSWSTWLSLSLLVFVLPHWIFFCFVMFSGHWIHSNYCQLCDLNAWPWIWRSRHGLRDLGYLCLYSSYSDDFFVVS